MMNIGPNFVWLALASVALGLFTLFGLKAALVAVVVSILIAGVIFFFMQAVGSVVDEGDSESELDRTS